MRILGMLQGLHDLNPDKPSVGIYGAQVATSTWVDAIIRYGEYDEYHMFVSNDDFDMLNERHRDWIRVNDNFRKIKLYRMYDIGNMLSSVDYSVFHNPRGLLNVADIAYIRNRFSKRWFPITSVHHTISYAHRFSSFLPMLFSGLNHGDALVCTSSSSQDALGRIIDMVKNGVNTVQGVNIQTQVPLYKIPLGVDCRNTFFPRDKQMSRIELNLPQDGLIFLWMGRFSDFDKVDLSVLIRVFAKLTEVTSEPVYLLLAGEDRYGYSEKLSALSVAYGVRDKLIFRKDFSQYIPRLLYAAADIFVAPTDNVQETFGLTVVEAMASGLPVITSDWDGYKDAVKHGVVGYRVPTYWGKVDSDVSDKAFLGETGDWKYHHLYLAESVVVDEDYLLDYMLKLVNEPELRKVMGMKAREHALNQFDWSVVIRQYEELWERLNGKYGNSTIEENNIYNFSYAELFASYPSFFINKHDIVFPKIQKIPYRSLFFINAELKHILSIDLVSRVVKAVDGRYTIEEVCGLMNESRPEKIMHVVLWLIKHGYLGIENHAYHS